MKNILYSFVILNIFASSLMNSELIDFIDQIEKQNLTRKILTDI
jgi:hypothetical protein